MLTTAAGPADGGPADGARPDRLTKVVIIGLGYVGLPLAIRAAEVGYGTVGYDTDSERVGLLLAGRSYVEDVPGPRLRDAMAAGLFLPSCDPRDCADFDIAVIATPTPLRDNRPDLSFLTGAATTIGAYVRRGATVVVESTSYPGTTQDQVQPRLEAASGLVAGRDFNLGYSPERIDPCNPEWTLEKIPKIVSGIDGSSLKAVRAFYDTIVAETVEVSAPREAELAKLIENTFRQINIALINEFAMVAHELGINIWEAIRAASTKPFGFTPFAPGPGVGGHCLPVDSAYLSWLVENSLGKKFRFAELAADINGHMPDYVARRLMLSLNARGMAVSGARLLLLGLAYKRNSGDARESPAVRVAQLLAGLGAAVRVADPHVVTATPVDATVTRVAVTPAEVAGADLTVLLTDHDAFDYEVIARHASYVFDCRARLSGRNVERL